MRGKLTKKEYVKLIRRTETELKRELKKPEARQDADLIDECLESLDYYRGQLNALCESGRAGARSFGFARTALTAALALVLTFALGATIAQAAGIRVWTAIFRGDAGYLRVDYVPDATAVPTEVTVWEDEQKSFYSHEEFERELAKNGFGGSLESWQGFEFLEGSIRSTKEEYYSSYTMRADDGYIRVRMIAKAQPDSTVSVWGLDENIPVVHLDISGIEAAYQTDEDRAFATWTEGSRIYSVSVFDKPACIEPLLYALIGGGE